MARIFTFSTQKLFFISTMKIVHKALGRKTGFNWCSSSTAKNVGSILTDYSWQIIKNRSLEFLLTVGSVYGVFYWVKPPQTNSFYLINFPLESPVLTLPFCLAFNWNEFKDSPHWKDPSETFECRCPVFSTFPILNMDSIFPYHKCGQPKFFYSLLVDEVQRQCHRLICLRTQRQAACCLRYSLIVIYKLKLKKGTEWSWARC